MPAPVQLLLDLTHQQGTTSRAVRNLPGQIPYRCAPGYRPPRSFRGLGRGNLQHSSTDCRRTDSHCTACMFNVNTHTYGIQLPCRRSPRREAPRDDSGFVRTCAAIAVQSHEAADRPGGRSLHLKQKSPRTSKRHPGGSLVIRFQRGRLNWLMGG